MIPITLASRKTWMAAFMNMKRVQTPNRTRLVAGLCNLYGVSLSNLIKKHFNGNVESKVGAVPRKKH